MNSIFKTRGQLDAEKDAAIFVPRPELERLWRAMQTPAVDSYYAILSARQTGKTTLLYQLRARLRGLGFGAALLDLNIVRVQSEANFYRFIASQILDEIDSVLSGKWKYAAEDELPTNAVEFRRMLFEVAQEASVPRLVILIDEVEGVPDTFADGFFGTIRNVFSSRRKDDEAAFEKYVFVFSGARELHRLTTGPNSPLNIADRIYLADFTLEGVQKLVSNFTHLLISVPADAAKWIWEQTRGHPYLTQKLCATIEQAHPSGVSHAAVEYATAQILRSDDHLEKMLIQIDQESAGLALLKKVLAGKPVRFSRLQPGIARLELMGALRDQGNCAIRNPIYEAAIRARFEIPVVPETLVRRVQRDWMKFVPYAALVLIGLNLPVMFFYLTDIVFADRAGNQRFEFKDPEMRGVIHYTPILQSGKGNETTISIEAERIGATAPALVEFRKTADDIYVESPLQMEFKPPADSGKFLFGLNTAPLYNPFAPLTSRRTVELVFISPRGGEERRELEYRVDFLTTFLLSGGMALVGLLSGLASTVREWGRIQDFLSALFRARLPADDDE